MGCQFLLQEDLPHSAIKPVSLASPVSPAWAGRFFTTEQPGKLQRAHHRNLVSIHNYTVDLLYPLCPPLNPPSPLVTATLLSMCLFWFDLAYAFYFILYSSETIQDLSLSDLPHLLFTLSVVTNGKTSSFFMAESYSILYTVDL